MVVNAAVVPLRDWVGLGDLLPLVLGASILLFARTAEVAQHLRVTTRTIEQVRFKRRMGTIWVGLILLVAYRVIVFIVDPAAAPMADCMFVNAIAMPTLMLVADGILLSWVLTEFGRALLVHLDWEPDDTVAFNRGIPSSILCCALMNPGRYVLMGCAIWEAQFTTPATWPASRWVPILWACTISQVLGLAWFGFPGVVAVMRRGSWRERLRAYATLIRRVGGQVLGLAILAIVLNVLALLPFYWIFGAMQRETWSLLGAASYGHYATLLLGIVFLAGVTQLACQELGIEREQGPVATLISEPPVAVPSSR